MSKLACKAHWGALPFRLRLRIRLSHELGEQEPYTKFVTEAIRFWQFESRRIVRG